MTTLTGRVSEYHVTLASLPLPFNCLAVDVCAASIVTCDSTGGGDTGGDGFAAVVGGVVLPRPTIEVWEVIFPCVWTASGGVFPPRDLFGVDMARLFMLWAAEHLWAHFSNTSLLYFSWDSCVFVNSPTPL